MLWWALAAFVVTLLVAPSRYLAWYLSWERRHTDGMAYYGKALAERRAIRQRIRRYSSPVLPFVRLMAAANAKRSTMPVFEYQGVCGPPRVSSPEVFARAQRYVPRREDVFVVTQMRCGTTWMQQLVFETVMRGQGDLTDGGLGHLYAVSPWIDAVNSVSIDAAPLVGERRTRIIKSHLPTSLCPYSPEAKYIYVTRHPVSCFASIVDYNRSLVGPLMPPVEVLADWFCSDQMYWLPWPKHVEGWWQWAARRDNVMFVHFEEMTRSFDAVRDRVASFLGYDLTAQERQLVTGKCSFQYMKDHEEWFEMAPPTMFSVVGGEYLKSGREGRHDDVAPAVRQKIADYCRSRLGEGEYPVGQFYPDLAPGGQN